MKKILLVAGLVLFMAQNSFAWWIGRGEVVSVQGGATPMLAVKNLNNGSTYTYNISDTSAKEVIAIALTAATSGLEVQAEVVNGIYTSIKLVVPAN